QRHADARSPWRLLEELTKRLAAGTTTREQIVEQCYDVFISMVAERPAHEQDALIYEGRALFRYATKTAHRAVEAVHWRTEAAELAARFRAYMGESGGRS